METLRLEGEPPITKWEDFKTLIKSHLYRIGLHKTNGSVGITLGKGRGGVCKSTPSNSRRWISC
jgi:hypothetical protein